jgi:D-beta-D-heptose 7-phosphate kinase/D-beta-D-heptose 1-phosphate adenosyltransferase
MSNPSRILTREQAAARSAVLRSAGCGIVFTNGCFDILHPGHVHVLSRAAALGDVLFVGVNTDDSVRRLKGTGRPVQNLEARASVLASIRYVDYVVPFSEDTPLELVAALRPHIIVKGGDYSRDEVAGGELADSVVIVPLLHGHSTTGLIRR